MRYDLRRIGRSLQAGGGLVLRGGQGPTAPSATIAHALSTIERCLAVTCGDGDHAVTRWASHFIDDTDGLTHLADDHYGAKMVGPHPDMAFTRCGHVVTWNGVRANAGTYVSTSTVLTCVRCAGGARDGRVRRTELKYAMFMDMYGTPPNKVLGPYAAADVAMTLALMCPRSVLRKCGRLAAVFYAKALEASHA